MLNYADKISSFIANAALAIGSVGFIYLITEYSSSLLFYT
jgi:hypothetical protein